MEKKMAEVGLLCKNKNVVEPLKENT